MKIFVTGGAGFIGSHLVDKLVAEGNQVTVYDNLSSGKKEFIQQHFQNSNFRFIRADLLHLEFLTKIMKNYDVVFHLAANPDARAGLVKTNLDLEQNTITTYNVLESMRINHIRRIVFTSSGTIYGEAPLTPVTEDYGPLLPISLYGASKLACEALISAFCHLFDVQAWIFRLGNIVGPRITHGVIYDFLNKLDKNPIELEVLGNGDQTKPYVYVDDCIDAMLFGLHHANEMVNVFNLAVSSVSSVKEIVQMILEKLKCRSIRVRYTGGERGWPGDIPQVRMSIDKLKKLGWEAKYTSNESIAKTIDDLIRERK